MLKWIGYSVLTIIVAGLIGFTAGYLTTSRYTPPAAADEARLRERAEEFYHGMQLMDFSRMAQIYTPARQLADHAELKQIAADRARSFMHFKPETRAEMMASITTINAGELEVRIEGDWAVTGGNRLMQKDGQDVPVPLQPLVWMRTAGDWWVYQHKTCDLLHYGAPPDFARDLLIDQEEAGIMETGPDSAGAIAIPQPEVAGEGGDG